MFSLQSFSILVAIAFLRNDNVQN